jgi:aryl-phospho-beta-D-glucosidase BglC (GH1 family)
MLFKALAALSAGLTLVAAGAQPSQPSNFVWGQTKIRGVNIGGWLVLEPWITPSMFERYGPADQSGIIDEYTLGQKVDAQSAKQALRSHWDSFVGLGDFQKIANSGFNVVRIPIGYWAYANAGTPYISGAAPYLDKAIGWARQTGLKVIIDLHGAPGSQNGFDNSGQRGGIQWTTGNTIQQTLNVLQYIQAKYGAASYDDVVIGIQLLNEPASFDDRVKLDTVKQFYRDGYGNQRTHSQNRVVVLHDAFKPPSTFNGFLTPQDNNAQNVAIDHHEYQVFNNDLVALSAEQHQRLVCQNAASWSGSDKWSFIGEWSAAITDCAPWLNGYGIYSRYDGSYSINGGSKFVGTCSDKNDIKQWNTTRKADIGRYIEAQLDYFERYSNGWIFWNVSHLLLTLPMFTPTYVLLCCFLGRSHASADTSLELIVQD